MTLGQTCDNPVKHRPTPIYTEKHHVVPRAWVKAGAPAGRIVEVCGTCHNDAHALYNLMIAYKGLVPWNMRRKFSKFVVDMANEAWGYRPSDNPPRTTPYGSVESVV